MRVRVLPYLLLLAALCGACEQGSGDYCQVNADCEPPLLCNAGTQQCQRTETGGQADAAPIPDAAIPPDAAPPDAAPDAAPDAGEPDAAADAGEPDAAP